MANAHVSFDTDYGDAPRYAEADLIEIVICTPSGFKKVKITPDGDIHEETETYADCHWCQAFGNVGDVPGAPKTSALITFDQTTLSWPDFTEVNAQSFPNDRPRSRAPPAEVCSG